jgi:hypothetical protein
MLVLVSHRKLTVLFDLNRAIGGEICVGVMASKDIPAGSELFYDYNYTVFGSGIRQRCRCGSVNCRGFIGKKRGGRDSTA